MVEVIQSEKINSIKGLAIIPLFKFIQKNELSWQTILANLTEEAKRDLSTMIKSQYALEDFFPTVNDALKLFSSFRWYPVSISNGLLLSLAHQMRVQKGQSLEKSYFEVGRFTASHDFAGILGYILKWGSILQMLEMGGKIWNHYMSEGELNVIHKAEGNIRFDIICSMILPEQQFVNKGWLTVLMEKKGIFDFEISTLYSKDFGGTIQHMIKWQ